MSEPTFLDLVKRLIERSIRDRTELAHNGGGAYSADTDPIISELNQLMAEPLVVPAGWILMPEKPEDLLLHEFLKGYGARGTRDMRMRDRVRHGYRLMVQALETAYERGIYERPVAALTAIAPTDRPGSARRRRMEATPEGQVALAEPAALIDTKPAHPAELCLLPPLPRGLEMQEPSIRDAIRAYAQEAVRACSASMEPGSWRSVGSDDGMRYPEACDLVGGETDTPSEPAEPSDLESGVRALSREAAAAFEESSSPGYKLHDLYRMKLDDLLSTYCGEAGHDEGRCGNASCIPKSNLTPPQPDGQPPLTVRFLSMPESNGKRNWTVLLCRKDAEGLLGDIASGVCFGRSEYYDRMRYHADRLRFLIGERDTAPYILDYPDDTTEPPSNL